MNTSTPSRLTRTIMAAVFSEKASITIFCISAVATFLCAVTEHHQTGAIFGAMMIPWLMSALKCRS